MFKWRRAESRGENGGEERKQWRSDLTRRDMATCFYATYMAGRVDGGGSIWREFRSGEACPAACANVSDDVILESWEKRRNLPKYLHFGLDSIYTYLGK